MATASFRLRATLLGVLVTPVFLFIMVMASGGGHGTNYTYYYLAKIFFPGAPVVLGDPNAPPPGMGGPGGPPGKGDAKGDSKKGH